MCIKTNRLSKVYFFHHRKSILTDHLLRKSQPGRPTDRDSFSLSRYDSGSILFFSCFNFEILSSNKGQNLSPFQFVKMSNEFEFSSTNFSQVPMLERHELEKCYIFINCFALLSTQFPFWPAKTNVLQGSIKKYLTIYECTSLERNFPTDYKVFISMSDVALATVKRSSFLFYLMKSSSNEKKSTSALSFLQFFFYPFKAKHVLLLFFYLKLFFFVNVTFIMDTRVSFFAWQYSKILRLEVTYLLCTPSLLTLAAGRTFSPLSNFSSKMSFRCCLNQARVQRRCTRNIYWPQVEATMGYFKVCSKTKRKVLLFFDKLSEMKWNSGRQAGRP